MRQGCANGTLLHDTLACAVAAGWDGATIEELLVMLAMEGGLVERVDPAGRPTRVVTGVDAGRFNRLWLDTVAQGARNAERWAGER